MFYSEQLRRQILFKKYASLIGKGTRLLQQVQKMPRKLPKPTPVNRQELAQTKQIAENWLKREGVDGSVHLSHQLKQDPRLMQQMGRTPKGLTAELRQKGLGFATPQKFSPTGKGFAIVHPSASPGVIMHEAGHLANMHSLQKRLGEPAVKAYARSREDDITRGSEAAGFMLAALTEEDSALGQAAPFLVAAGNAPMIIEEGLASRRGLKELGRVTGAEAVRRARPALRRGLLSYAMEPIAVALAAQAVHSSKSVWKPAGTQRLGEKAAAQNIKPLTKIERLFETLPQKLALLFTATR